MIRFTDRARGVYQKLVVRDGRLAGAILVGDTRAAAELTQLFDRGAALPADRSALLLARRGGPAGDGPAAGLSAAALPGRATVCRCNGVTKDGICAAWQDGARRLDDVADRTRATTGCGTCRDLVGGVLAWLAAGLAGRPGRRRARHWAARHWAACHWARAGRSARMIPAGHLVVAGNGMVGQRFVEELRARDPAGLWRVTVLAEEGRRAYDRVALSSYLDGASAADLDIVAPGCYDGPGCELRLGEAVTGIDRAGRAVITSRGDRVGYDALVLATGSVPFVPPVPGAALPGCFPYRTIDDLDAIRAWAGRAPPRPAAGAWSSAAGCSAWRPPGRCGCSAWTRTWSRSRRGCCRSRWTRAAARCCASSSRTWA